MRIGTSKHQVRAWNFITAGLLVLVMTVPALAYNGYDRPSPEECDVYARNYAERYSDGFISGAARGAIRGAVVGGIIGGRKGARRGAVLGGVVRGTRQAINRDEIRRRAYEDCMYGRIRW